MSGRISLLKPLEGDQAAASHPTRQVWLSASAGTGKTHVLTARVLRLLLNGAAPETILCLTFTKAGAAEMAERIQARLASWVRMSGKLLREELGALAERNDDECGARSTAAVRQGARRAGRGLRIQTIHAFCQTLLAGFPTEAGLSPGFRPLEGRAEAALGRRHWPNCSGAERGGDLGLIRDIQALSRRMGEEKAERYLMLCARAPDELQSLGSREGIEARVRIALDVWLGDVEERILAESAPISTAPVCIGSRRPIVPGAPRPATIALAVANAFLAADGAGRAAMLDAVRRIAVTKEGEPYSFSAKLLDCDPAHADNCADLADAVGMLLGQRNRAELVRRCCRRGCARARHMRWLMPMRSARRVSSISTI
jgi:ATP-dependent helicase/nuclease subunit A